MSIDPEAGAGTGSEPRMVSTHSVTGTGPGTGSETEAEEAGRAGAGTGAGVGTGPGPELEVVVAHAEKGAREEGVLPNPGLNAGPEGTVTGTEDTLILKYITLIGCSLSLVGLIINLLLFITNSVERQIIHNIMGSSLLEDGRSTNSSLKFLSLNVLNISEAYLDATGTKDWIHTEAPQNKTRLQCHYFDEQEWHWKTDGCETTTLNNSNDIICNCDHTTPFAVLLIREPIAEIHWRILSYISYMGCGLSAFFTALSLVLYVFSRNHRQDYSICIHVSLSGALFLLNSTFLLTEWGATVELDWVCVLVAALMHYSLLCSFTWMAIEALHLYLLLIKVFNTYYKHYMVKLSLAGWGIPGVIVAISLGMKDFKQFYGITQMTMADTNQTNAICWITDDSFFYSLNLVYFTLIFIFNSGILMTVASSICKIKQVYRGDLKHQSNTGEDSWNYPEKFGATCRSGVTVLGLTCLMGTTWGLAFLGSGYVNYAILYLFCIFNSIQGFFIFLWICQSVRKQRRRYIEDKMTSSPVRVTGTKAD
ncbi:Adhesion G-protein coupled receptor G6 G-protein coupled receptor 126 [Channa argus]|uniref:Adhesion G-protein coupled receptor G6 G-protein coupled receptor 126 n=1 Tax=Channa argus TaxID=215402 RepID=A0A6G1P9L0_CHAAH|nr:Adhesion G-protein coupled receptor G6 G-protein coupled receptor 126 [Channa argus]